MKQDEMILANHPFFKDVDGWYLQQLTKGSYHQSFHAGEYLIEAGQPADRFFLILKGNVNILTDKLDSIEDAEPAPTAIQTLGAGEVLGWSWIVAPFQWRFDAKAIDSVEVIAINAGYLREKCEEDPRLGYELLKRITVCMTERLIATRLQLALHSGKPFKQAEGA